MHNFPLMTARLFPDMHRIHRTILLFRLECVAHRLLKTGFESHVNCYCSRELVILAYMMPLQSRKPLLAEALSRAQIENCEVVLAFARDAA